MSVIDKLLPERKKCYVVCFTQKPLDEALWHPDLPGFGVDACIVTRDHYDAADLVTNLSRIYEHVSIETYYD
jgi:hypothetical protein